MSDFLWPFDYSLPGSFVHGIFQARILEWVAISYSRGSSQPGSWTRISVTCIGRQVLSHWSHLGSPNKLIHLLYDLGGLVHSCVCPSEQEICPYKDFYINMFLEALFCNSSRTENKSLYSSYRILLGSLKKEWWTVIDTCNKWLCWRTNNKPHEKSLRFHVYKIRKYKHDRQMMVVKGEWWITERHDRTFRGDANLPKLRW